jgi:hypothetical protein
MANPAELLQLLINFDLLQEATALALEYLNAVMGRGKEYFGIEVRCQHWTTTFEISFSGSSGTNHNSLLQNTTYTAPPRLRHLFQVVQSSDTNHDSLL